MLASDLIHEVSTDLNDQWSGSEYARWTQDMLLAYLNEAETMIVFLKPQSYVVSQTVQLSEGEQQKLPDGTNTFQSPTGDTHPQAIELIRVSRNMGEDGETPGPTIHQVDPKDLDDVLPDWRSDTASGVVVHFMFNKNDRTRFDVYPSQPASSHWVEVYYSAVPHKIEKSGTSYDVSINLGAEYAPALRTYMLFRAYSLDAQNSEVPMNRALNAWSQFVSLIGRKDLIEKSLPAQRGSQHASSDPKFS